MAIFHMFHTVHTNYESEQMSNWFWGCRTMPDNLWSIFWFKCNAMNIYSGFAFHDFFWYDFTLPCDSSLGRYINLLLFLSCPMVLNRMKRSITWGKSAALYIEFRTKIQAPSDWLVLWANIQRKFSTSDMVGPCWGQCRTAPLHAYDALWGAEIQRLSNPWVTGLLTHIEKVEHSASVWEIAREVHWGSCWDPLWIVWTTSWVCRRFPKKSQTSFGSQDGILLVINGILSPMNGLVNDELGL